MKRNSNPSLEDSNNVINKEKNHNEYPKITFNLLEKSTRKDFDKKIKQSMVSSNSKSKNFPNKVNSFLNNNNNNEQPKKLLKKLSKANLSIDGVPVAKSSLNIKNNLVILLYFMLSLFALFDSIYSFDIIA